jgi:hypothetical protein
MAIQSKRPGDNTTAGPIKTPAPRVQTRSGGTSYGQAQDQSPSSLPPGAATISEMGANLKSSVNDPVLDQVIAKGTSKSAVGYKTDSTGIVSDQLRKIADGIPTHPHMRDANSGGAPSGKVPEKTGAVQGEPVRKPGA